MTSTGCGVGMEGIGTRSNSGQPITPQAGTPQGKLEITSGATISRAENNGPYQAAHGLGTPVNASYQTAGDGLYANNASVLPAYNRNAKAQ